MSEHSWYNVRRAANNKIVVTKFTSEMEFVCEYTIEEDKTKLRCDCMAGLQGKYCRHQKTFHYFNAEGRVGPGWLYNFDLKQWKEPTKPEDIEGGESGGDV